MTRSGDGELQEHAMEILLSSKWTSDINSVKSPAASMGSVSMGHFKSNVHEKGSTALNTLGQGQSNSKTSLPPCCQDPDDGFPVTKARLTCWLYDKTAANSELDKSGFNAVR